MSYCSSIGSSFGGCYSPDRSRDVDRFNPSTRGNYSTAFSNASGSYSTGYWYSADRSRDVDRYNSSTRGNYPACDLFG